MKRQSTSKLKIPLKFNETVADLLKVPPPPKRKQVKTAPKARKQR